MTQESDPWSLPGLAAYLGDVIATLSQGLVVIKGDSFRPRGLPEALRAGLRGRFGDIEVVGAVPGRMPAEVVAEPLGASPTLDALLGSDFDQCLVLITLDSLGSGDSAAWTTFLTRFQKARRRMVSGLALIALDAPPEIRVSGMADLVWTGRLRRGDLVIWAEQHLPATRTGLAEHLAVSLAVELCAWRLDLAARCVRMGLDDLGDPESWLGLLPDAAAPELRLVAGQAVACPLRLVRSTSVTDRRELRARLWRAHLAAVFPWIEEQRLDVLQRHRARLRVDDHARALSVHDVEELELGAIFWQLERKLDRSEAQAIERLVRMRNALAHRKPAVPSDLRDVISARTM